MIDRWIYGMKKRSPLETTQRASLALSSMYSRVDRRADDSLAGNSAWTKQSAWNMLAGAWGIKGVTIAAKRDKAREVLGWLRDEGDRAESEGRDFVAWDAARLVNVARRCVHAGFLEEPEAWDWVLAGGRLAAPAFDGWRSYAGAFLRAREVWAGGSDAGVTEAVNALLTEPESIWNTTPWQALPR
jgi:hypothetical protein